MPHKGKICFRLSDWLEFDTNSVISWQFMLDINSAIYLLHNNLYGNTVFVFIMNDWLVFDTYSGIFLPYHTRMTDLLLLIPTLAYFWYNTKMTDKLLLTYCNEKQFVKINWFSKVIRYEIKRSYHHLMVKNRRLYLLPNVKCWSPWI